MENEMKVKCMYLEKIKMGKTTYLKEKLIKLN